MSSDVSPGADQASDVMYADYRKQSSARVAVEDAEPSEDVHGYMQTAHQAEATATEAVGVRAAADSDTPAPTHGEPGAYVQDSTQEPDGAAADSAADQESHPVTSSSAAPAVPAAAAQRSFNRTATSSSSRTEGEGAQLHTPPSRPAVDDPQPANGSSAAAAEGQAGAVSAGKEHAAAEPSGASATSAAADAPALAAGAAPPPSTATNSTSTSEVSRALRRYPTTSADLERFLKEQNMLSTDEPKKAADPQKEQGSALLALLAVGVLGAAAAAAAVWNWWKARKEAPSGQGATQEDAAVQEQLQKARKAAAGANAVAADIDAFLDGIGDSIDEEDLPPARPRAAAAAPAPTAKAPAQATGAAAAADAAQEAAVKEQEEKARRAAAGARAVAADIDKFLDLDVDEDVDLDQLSPEELAALEEELAELEGLDA